MDGSVAVDAATCAPALCAAIEGGLGLGLAGVRKEGNEGQEGNEGREGADSVGVAVRDALARAHAGDGVNLGGRLRFLAGRALAALESADAARGSAGGTGGLRLSTATAAPFNRGRRLSTEVR